MFTLLHIRNKWRAHQLLRGRGYSYPQKLKQQFNKLLMLFLFNYQLYKGEATKENPCKSESTACTHERVQRENEHFIQWVRGAKSHTKVS